MVYNIHMSYRRKQIIYIIVFAFVLNLAWENAHVRLYTNIFPGVNLLPFLLIPTFCDMVIILAGYKLLKKLGITPLSWRGVSFLVVYGLIVALIIEAVSLRARWWSYAPAMPILPLADVGVSPILQMVLLPVLSIYAAMLVSRYNISKSPKNMR